MSIAFTVIQVKEGGGRVTTPVWSATTLARHNLVGAQTEVAGGQSAGGVLTVIDKVLDLGRHALAGLADCSLADGGEACHAGQVHPHNGRRTDVRHHRDRPNFADLCSNSPPPVVLDLLMAKRGQQYRSVGALAAHRRPAACCAACLSS